MAKSFKNIFSELFMGSKEENDIEQRAFIISTSFALILSFCGVIISLAINHELTLVFFEILLTMIFGAFNIIARFTPKNEPFKYLFILVILTALLILWLLNGGIQGPNLILIMLGLMASLIIIKRNFRPIIAFVFLLLVYIFYFIEYFYPELIVGYKFNDDRFIDHIITFTVVTAFIFFIVINFLNNYNDQKKRGDDFSYENETISNNLNSLNLELSQKKSEIEIQNQELSENNRLISEQKLQLETLQYELDDLTFTKDKFLSIISHDIKNPIFALRNMAEIMETYYENMNDKEILNAINSMYKSASFTVDLLDNLLQWSRSHTGKIECNLEPLYLSEFINPNIDIYSLIAEKKEITITNELLIDYCIVADRNMLNTIFRNLLSNSIKFTRPKGKIAIRAYEFEDQIEIEIEDDGVGMREETRNKLFQIELIKSTLGTNSEKGTGLGLMVVKEFVEKNGGKIRVESTWNVGTSFFFTINKCKES